MYVLLVASIGRHTWLWRDKLLGGPLAVDILVLEVAERPGHSERPVDPLDHHAAARVLDPFSLGRIRRFVILIKMPNISETVES